MTLSISVTIFIPDVSREDSTVSTHVSDSPPMYMKTSAFFIFMISAGVGSYECVSSPGRSRFVTFPLSPTTALAKSYTGNIVVTMLNPPPSPAFPHP